MFRPLKSAAPWSWQIIIGYYWQTTMSLGRLINDSSDAFAILPTLPFFRVIHSKKRVAKVFRANALCCDKWILITNYVGFSHSRIYLNVMLEGANGWAEWRRGALRRKFNLNAIKEPRKYQLSVWIVYIKIHLIHFQYRWQNGIRPTNTINLSCLCTQYYSCK